ncbi:RagB/SusD family nutrient uptake outer membrane protein [Flavobacterium faecale]|uniref:RagB/SusD family nutrient uptake outer membrane protein n=1 Tax=Flavobacterium faecale TaxID=1355330 RepID=A0A2S1LCE5_9FLAO|nr:RagB/SusD family nutrient uptake outer membrane protein [Flavobacterium faecale]AWG21367.1 RagB/SusD family nutrient uptake outer membrane protein [Flavobacterium faecale]
MKNIIKTIILTAVVLGMNSCSESNLLELSPINNISEADAFTSPSLIAASMNGVYNAAAVGQYTSTSTNGGRGYLWGAAFVEQGDCRGEDVVNTGTFYQLTYTATYDATTANNVYYWIDGYRLINRCNLMIEGVNTAVAQGIITSAVGNDYIGQAKFLRAITHFELLNFFARCYNFTPTASHLGIPYREVGINTQAEIDSEVLKPRNTVEECYTKILADLTAAENQITTTGIAKASKGAAIAFKTRVYLHKREWSNVITEGNKLKTLYSLTANPGDVFVLANNFNNTESIFSTQHTSTINPTTNGALASMYGGRRLVAISPIIWRNTSWLSDDKRRNSTALTGMVQNVSGRMYTNKYKDITTYTDGAPVIRYAEVVLNMAEASARLTTPDLGTALTLLNSVRNRSLATPATQAYTAATLSTPTAMINAILTERRIEFLMEGRRWSDIQRLEKDNLAPIAGIPAKYANVLPPAADYTLGTAYTGALTVLAIPAADTRFLWPIPQVENNTNPTLAAQQNPGW